MEENKFKPSVAPADTERRQNLPEIIHISAAHSGCIDAVLAAMRDAEKLSLTLEQMDMGYDIVQSVQEHGEQYCGLTAYYLIRYGMLIERGNHGDKKDCRES